MAKKGLGRGFDSLIPTDFLDETFDPTAAQDNQVSELRYVKLSDVVADPDQPRRHFEETALEELAASIREHGILQPIVVASRNGTYQIIAGERRYRAANRAGLEKIPVIVRTLTDQHKLELSLIENIHRRDLSPIEIATAYAKLRDQFNMTLDQIGEKVGSKSASTISNTLRLLKLPLVVRRALAEGKVTEGQVRPLIGIDEAIAEKLLPSIVTEQWSARQVEQHVAQYKPTASREKKAAPAVAKTHYERDAQAFTTRFKTPVAVHTTAKGSGTIVISFRNDDEFTRIRKVLDSTRSN